MKKYSTCTLSSAVIVSGAFRVIGIDLRHLQNRSRLMSPRFCPDVSE